MAQKTDIQLSTQADEVRDETTANANTATRVGTLFEDIVDSKMNNSLLIDEDNMASDSATRVPSQQSVKAYVDAQAGETASAVTFTPAGNIAATDVQAALEEVDTEKIKVKVRNDVTLANGVVTINWAAGDIQNLTITEAKVITTISNPVVYETIILIIPGTNSLTFSGLTAVIEGTYQSGVENRIYIQCLKVSGGAEYRITYDHSSSPFPFSSLTDAATVTWTVAAFEAISNRLLTIAGNRTFSITGALSGYSGNVKVTASGAARTISIPAGTSHRMKGVGDTTVKTLQIPQDETYIISWLYDGTNYDWWYID